MALDEDWVVVGLANCRIHVFNAKSGVLSRTLIGHEQGVWAVHLISRGGYWGGGAMGNRKKGKGRRRKCEDEDDLMTSLDSEPASISAHIEPPTLDRLVPPSLRTALGLDENTDPYHLYRERETDVDDEAEVKSDGRGDECCATEGWGQPNALVISGGCDKILRVWDVNTG